MSKCCFKIHTALFSTYVVLSLAILTFVSLILGNDVFFDGGDGGGNDGGDNDFKEGMAIATLCASGLFALVVAIVIGFQIKNYRSKKSANWEGPHTALQFAVALGMLAVGSIAVTFSAVFAPEEEEDGEKQAGGGGGSAALSWIYYVLVAVAVVAICFPIGSTVVMVIKGDKVCTK